MFHTLSDVQREGGSPPPAIHRQPRGAPLHWPQVNHLRGGVVQHRTGGDVFLEKHGGGGEPKETLAIPPGLYGFDQLKEVLEGASSRPTHTLKVSRANGLPPGGESFYPMACCRFSAWTTAWAESGSTPACRRAIAP